MNNNFTTLDRRQRLRKVAVLVASLDAPLAERLLGDLAPDEANAVRELAKQFEDIDPTEQQAVLTDMRQALASSAEQGDRTTKDEFGGCRNRRLAAGADG